MYVNMCECVCIHTHTHTHTHLSHGIRDLMGTFMSLGRFTPAIVTDNVLLYGVQDPRFAPAFHCQYAGHGHSLDSFGGFSQNQKVRYL